MHPCTDFSCPPPVELQPPVLDASHSQWRVHTSRLLALVVENPECTVLRIPLSIFGKILAAVGERAAQLNDPEMNSLMARLTIYTVADPDSPDYDPVVAKELLNRSSAPI